MAEGLMARILAMRQRETVPGAAAEEAPATRVEETGARPGAATQEEDLDMSTSTAANRPGATDDAAPTVPTAEAAAAAAKSRIKAILTADEAKGRGKMAEHLAFETEMSIEQAKALLATAPKEAADAGFLAHMAQEKNPQLGTGGATAETPDQQLVAAAKRRAAGMKAA